MSRFHDEYDRLQTGRDKPTPEEQRYWEEEQEPGADEHHVAQTVQQRLRLARRLGATFGESSDEADGEA